MFSPEMEQACSSYNPWSAQGTDLNPTHKDAFISSHCCQFATEIMKKKSK